MRSKGQLLGLMNLQGGTCCEAASPRYLSWKHQHRMSPEGTSHRRYYSLSQHLMTSGMIQKWIFKADLARMLPHNKFLLAGSFSLTIVLSNACVTSNLGLLSCEVWKVFEHPLEIMLMLLGIVVENSKQYGSKWHKLFFQIVWKSLKSVPLRRATHHSIRNVSSFPTHIHMSSCEKPGIL